MPLQSRAAQGFAGVAVEIDLILKGIKTNHEFTDAVFSFRQWK